MAVIPEPVEELCGDLRFRASTRVESSGPVVEKHAGKELEMLLVVRRRPKTGEGVCTRELIYCVKKECGYKRKEVNMHAVHVLAKSKYVTFALLAFTKGQKCG